MHFQKQRLFAQRRYCPRPHRGSFGEASRRRRVLPIAPHKANWPHSRMLAAIVRTALPISLSYICSNNLRMYNSHALEKRWPGLLQAWVLYHVGPLPALHAITASVQACVVIANTASGPDAARQLCHT